jgi:hypothetical protein
MSMSLLRRSVLGAVALLAPSLALPTAGHALIYVIDQDNLGVNCSGPSGCGTVEVTSVGTTYTFTVDLTAASGFVLHTTPGEPQTIAFNLAGVSNTGFTGPINAPTAGPQEDGFGTFLFGVERSRELYRAGRRPWRRWCYRLCRLKCRSSRSYARRGPSRTPGGLRWPSSVGAAASRQIHDRINRFFIRARTPPTPLYRAQ